MQITDDGREWYTTKEKLPDKDVRILAIVNLPTGRPVLMPGTINGDWFMHAFGGMSSLNAVHYWRPATDEESVELWDESNWIG